MKIIALEESFWYEKLATEGSTVSHVQVKSAVAADWQRRLVDFTEYKLPDMDRNGVDMQVLSLTSPVSRCSRTRTGVEPEQRHIRSFRCEVLPPVESVAPCGPGN
jgi:hypothetical protein